MKTIFTTLLVIFTAVMCVCCIYFKRTRTEVSKSLFRLHCGAIFSCVLYLFSIFNLPALLSYFINSIYYASIHFLLILLTDFIFTLTQFPFKEEHKKYVVSLKKIWLFLFTLDALSFLLNPFFHHEFELSRLFVNKDVFLCWTPRFFWPFQIHLGLCYILSALIFIVLGIKIWQTNRFYRYKYIITIAIFFIVLLINAFFLWLDTYLDFSILLYSVFSIICSYFTIYATTKRVQNTMLQQLSETINIGIFVFNLDRKCIFSNKTAKNLQFTTDALLEELKSLLIYRKDLIKRNIKITLNDEPHTLAEEFCYLRDSQKKVCGYILKMNDITEELKRSAEESYRSTHDELTGLLTRKAFFEEGERILKSDPKTERYLICTNIKNFKLLNDLCGSEIGDTLLKEFANLLKAKNTKSILSGRITGDRFAILINKDDLYKDHGLEKIFKLENFISDSQLANYKFHIFIGIYPITDPTEKMVLMYDKATLTLKNISDNYSINVAYYKKELLSDLKKNKKILDSFKQALKNNHFKMYLQPQVRCSDEKVAGAEALVRWETENGSSFSPGKFIRVLEDNGQIYRLDQFIWEQAAQTIQRWQTQKIDLSIAVNVSANDFYHLDLFKHFTALVKKYGIPPQKLKLEITETVLIHDLTLHKQTLTKLQDFGFIIEMDDFGSGYSSLMVLKNIDVDILKIDMAFLSKTEHEERSKKILQYVIKMAQKLGIKIIVEGVETLEQAKFLKKLHCDFFQGYLYSKPVSMEEFERKFLQQFQKTGQDGGNDQ